MRIRNSHLRLNLYEAIAHHCSPSPIAFVARHLFVKAGLLRLVNPEDDTTLLAIARCQYLQNTETCFDHGIEAIG